MGTEPHSEKAQTPELQFGKTAVYIYPDSPAVDASVRFTHSSVIVTTFGFLEAPSVNESILLDMTQYHSSEIRFLWASNGPRVPIPWESASEIT